ncbi:MAG: hypothetical protein R6X35_06700 [Candidatus Krumholzibacteriia bacterium]
MQISAISQPAVTAAPAARTRPAAAAPDAGEVRRPGRSHLQRDLKHLVRDVRHQVKAELQELRASGEDDGKSTAVRAAFHEFRDQVQAVFHTAGKGGDFDAATVPAGLGEAMAAFTAALRELNGTPAEDPAVAAPTPEQAPGKLPDAMLDLPSGSLLDVVA